MTAIHGDVLSVLLERWVRHGPTLMVEFSSRAALPYCAVTDAVWRFGVSISTDDVQRAGAPFVQLKLTLGVRGSSFPCNELIELSLPQFYAMLATLERAKSYTAFLSAGSDAVICGPSTM